MLNLVVASGVLKSPALRYDHNTKPEYRFTLESSEASADGRTFTLYLPCCASGATAERLASELDEGMHIALTSAKLCYRKRQTQKSGEQSRLEILVWSAEVLSTSTGPAQAEAPEYVSGSDHGALLVEAPSVLEPKKARKPSRTRASLLAYAPGVN